MHGCLIHGVGGQQAITVSGVVFVRMLTKWCRFHFSYHPWEALGSFGGKII